jgi:aflatoxin B1 aldehyde reductase
MTFGAPGKEGARVTDLADVEAILDAFLSHGHKEIDSARTYTSGSCLNNLQLVPSFIGRCRD